MLLTMSNGQFWTLMVVLFILGLSLVLNLIAAGRHSKKVNGKKYVFRNVDGRLEHSIYIPSTEEGMFEAYQKASEYGHQHKDYLVCVFNVFDCDYDKGEWRTWDQYVIKKDRVSPPRPRSIILLLLILTISSCIKNTEEQPMKVSAATISGINGEGVIYFTFDDDSLKIIHSTRNGYISNRVDPGDKIVVQYKVTYKYINFILPYCEK